MEANVQLNALTTLRPRLQPSVCTKPETVLAPKPVRKTQKYPLFAGKLWFLDRQARQLVTTPTELLRLEIQQRPCDNLKFGTGKPRQSVLCRRAARSSDALLAASFGFLAHFSLLAPYSQGYLVNKTHECMQMSVSVATAYEISMPISGIYITHHPLTTI